MGEITVKGKKYVKDPYERPNKLYRTPSNRIIMDSLSQGDRNLNLFSLISKKVPGISVHGSQIQIRGPVSLVGNNEPLIMLDGIPVESDYMYDYPPTEIAFIDILNTSNSAIYGGNNGNGIIAFYTRSGSVVPEDEERQGIINFTYPGYYLAREFYSPDYDIKDEKHARPDYRRTLYWNPTLTTDEKGDISYSFFMSDEEGTFRVQVEGMTHSGLPVKRDYYFSVK